MVVMVMIRLGLRDSGCGVDLSLGFGFGLGFGDGNSDDGSAQLAQVGWITSHCPNGNMPLLMAAMSASLAPICAAASWSLGLLWSSHVIPRFLLITVTIACEPLHVCST